VPGRRLRELAVQPLGDSTVLAGIRILRGKKTIGRNKISLAMRNEMSLPMDQTAFCSSRIAVVTRATFQDITLKFRTNIISGGAVQMTWFRLFRWATLPNQLQQPNQQV
jgi:hypothetical protein